MCICVNSFVNTDERNPTQGGPLNRCTLCRAKREEEAGCILSTSDDFPEFFVPESLHSPNGARILGCRVGSLCRKAIPTEGES